MEIESNPKRPYWQMKWECGILMDNTKEFLLFMRVLMRVLISMREVMRVLTGRCAGRSTLPAQYFKRAEQITIGDH